MDLYEYAKKQEKSFNDPSFTQDYPDNQFVNVVNPPWVVAPDGYLAVDEQSSVTLPIVGVSTDVLTYVVPDGWSAIFNKYSCSFEGAGFTAGSGDIVYKLFINDQPYKGFSAINTDRGNNINQRDLGTAGIQAFPKDVIRWVVEHVNNGGINGTVTCTLTGWIYPYKSITG